MIQTSKQALQRIAAAGELLLERRRPHAGRALEARELLVETVAAGSFVLAAAGLALARAPSSHFPAGEAVVLMLTYVVLARARFAIGSGFTMPTQIASVPILLLLPPAYAPAFVGAALVLSRMPDVVTRRAPAERLVTSIADAWYIVAPATLLALVAPDHALERTGWLVWVAALGLQILGDWIVSTLRESIGAGVPPSSQAGVIGQIAIVDVLLSPIGLMAAFATAARPYAFLLTLPLVGGLSLFARERAGRIARALVLIDDLDREHQRVLAAQRRVGETAAANLDRRALEQIIVASAVELVAADAGRLSVISTSNEPLHMRAQSGDASDLEEALNDVASDVDTTGRPTECGGTAVAVRIQNAGGPPNILAVARHGRDFSAVERERLVTLAEQAAVCLQNLALHERVRRLASTDELTQLLNHRRLQEVLEYEVRRAERYGTPLALLMLDIDDFKQVNDRHGHQQGDAVLRAVAAVLKSSVRSVDATARYGGEELAVALPNMDLPGALTLAERIREAIAANRVLRPDGVSLSVTASIGVAVLDDPAWTRRDLIAAADRALYCAKRAGKNRVEHAAGWVALTPTPTMCR